VCVCVCVCEREREREGSRFSLVTLSQISAWLVGFSLIRQ